MFLETAQVVTQGCCSYRVLAVWHALWFITPHRPCSAGPIWTRVNLQELTMHSTLAQMEQLPHVTTPTAECTHDRGIPEVPSTTCIHSRSSICDLCLLIYCKQICCPKCSKSMFTTLTLYDLHIDTEDFVTTLRPLLSPTAPSQLRKTNTTAHAAVHGCSVQSLHLNLQRNLNLRR